MTMLQQVEALAHVEPRYLAPPALTELASRVYQALETYSNVHRGTGFNSEVTTALFEKARTVVLEHLGLSKSTHVVVFTSPLGAQELGAQLDPKYYQVLSSQELDLPLGVRAIAVQRHALKKCIPRRTGGGTVKFVSENAVIWSDLPERFEAGTIAIMNVIAMACGLLLTKRFGLHCNLSETSEESSVESIFYHDEFSKLSGQALLNALRQSIVGFGTTVPTTSGYQTYTHLDHAASTSTFLPVWSCVCQVWKQSSQVRRAIVSRVKAICSEFLGAPSDEYTVIFTSNTTEALNAVAANLDYSVKNNAVPVVLSTWLEHNSNELPWRLTPQAKLLRLSVDEEGFFDLDELRETLKLYNFRHEQGNERIILVTVSGASNVLGTYNDLEAVVRIAHQYGARVLVDAAQLAAHRTIEMSKWGVDYLVLSGHKLYAPFGSGVLVARKDIIAHRPLVWEAIMACGEENVSGIAAIGKAMVLLQKVGMDTVEAEERKLTRRALKGLSEIENIEVWGVRDPDSPNLKNRGGIIAFSVATVPHNRVAQELAEHAGMGVRTGCHCAHLLVKRVLSIPPCRVKAAAFGAKYFPSLFYNVLPGVVRVSFGMSNDEKDVELFLNTLKAIVAVNRSASEVFFAKTHNGTPFLGRSRIKDQTRRLIRTIVREVYDVGGVERAVAAPSALPRFAEVRT
jgi:selenocysteine lyase/cysteine desulfurase